MASTKNASAIPAVQARRLFPQFGTRAVVPDYVGPGNNDVEARSTYDAVFFSAGRRLTRGLQFHTSYTFSRWMSNNDMAFSDGGTDGSHQRPQSMFDYEVEWARSNFDRPHRFTASYIWEIPGPTPAPCDTCSTAGRFRVTSTQSGRPFTILTGVDSSGDANTGSDRRHQPSGSFVWDKTQDLHQQRLLCRAIGITVCRWRTAATATRRETAVRTRLCDLSLLKRVPFGEQLSLESAV